MTSQKRNILKRLVLPAILISGSMVFAAVNTANQNDNSDGGSYVEFLPSCEEQGLKEDFTTPNFKSFVEPHSPALAATAWEYCLIANDIDKQALQHLDTIDANRDKSLVELLNESSNMYCYGGYGDCGLSDDTLYQQYVNACQTAFDRASDKLAETDASIKINDPFYISHMENCNKLARSKLKSYRDIANIQIVQNQVKLVEEHNLKKLDHNHNQLKSASKVEDNVYEMLERAVIALGGFTSEQDENLPPQRNAPRDPIQNSYVNNPGPRIQDVDQGNGSCPTCNIFGR